MPFHIRLSYELSLHESTPVPLILKVKESEGHRVEDFHCLVQPSLTNRDVFYVMLDRNYSLPRVIIQSGIQLDTFDSIAIQSAGRGHRYLEKGQHIRLVFSSKGENYSLLAGTLDDFTIS
jgi:hypothetical protein